MTKPWNRRELMGAVGVGIAGVAVPAWAAPALRRKSSRRDDMTTLVEEITAAERSDVFDVVEPFLRAGLPWQDLEAAVFLAGIHEVQPRPVGFKLHCVMVTESVFQLAEASPKDERLPAVLWNLDDFKNSQERDVREGDWTLPAAPDVSFASKEEAARELAAALDAWDDERADRAVVGALPLLGLEATFELLWPYTMRDFHNLGHKPIFASHVLRVLRRIGEQHAVCSVRSVVRGLLDGAPGPNVEEFQGSRKAARDLRVDWTEGERAPERSLAIARAIRGATPAEARRIIVERSNEGLRSTTVWDGIRLAATDLFARQPGLLPVHPTTVSSALHYICRSTSNDTTGRIALLQAASWLPLFRDALSQRSGFEMGAGGIDPLVREVELEPIVVDDLFDAPTLDGARACLDQEGALGPFSERLRTNLFRGVREHHEPKYAAVLLEDVRTADPAWHPALLGAALQYLPSAKTRTTRLFERSRELGDRVGGG